MDFRVDCADPDCATEVVLNLRGALTMSETGTVREAVRKIVVNRPGVPLVIDLNGLTQIDTPGITALINAQNLARGEKGRLKVRLTDAGILKAIMDSGLGNRLVLDITAPVTEPAAIDVMRLDPPSTNR